jgi:hypothetical protein
VNQNEAEHQVFEPMGIEVMEAVCAVDGPKQIDRRPSGKENKRPRQRVFE